MLIGRFCNLNMFILSNADAVLFHTNTGGFYLYFDLFVLKTYKHEDLLILFYYRIPLLVTPYTLEDLKCYIDKNNNNFQTIKIVMIVDIKL